MARCNSCLLGFIEDKRGAWKHGCQVKDELHRAHLAKSIVYVLRRCNAIVPIKDAV